MPLGVLCLFRWLSQAAPHSPWWVWVWSSEIPFFAFVLSATVVVKCQGIIAQFLPTTEPPAPIVYMRIVAGAVGLTALLVLFFLYADTMKMVAFDDETRARLALLSLSSGVGALALGIGTYILDVRLTSARAHAAGQGGAVPARQVSAGGLQP
jgi:ABC-type arginine transport system permease subunit